MNQKNLEKRLIQFSTSILNYASNLPKKLNGRSYLKNQVSRSSIAAALNYGEAQSAESRKDFIHKMRISLKELRETYIALQIIQELQDCNDVELKPILIENNELISIFVSSIKTASLKI